MFNKKNIQFGDSLDWLYVFQNYQQQCNSLEYGIIDIKNRYGSIGFNTCVS